MLCAQGRRRADRLAWTNLATGTVIAGSCRQTLQVAQQFALDSEGRRMVRHRIVGRCWGSSGLENWRVGLIGCLVLAVITAAPRTAAAQGYGSILYGSHNQPRQRGGASLISAKEAERQGLKRAWFTAMEVDRAHGEVAYVTQNVSYARGYVVYDVEVGGRRAAAFSERDINTFQEKIGEAEAKRLADRYAANYVAGHPQESDLVKVVKRVVPEVTLFASTTAGMVHAIDGETGRTRWSHTYGALGHPTLEVAANDRFVAIINGIRLYVVNRDDGVLVFEKRLQGVPGAGPQLSDQLVFVPSLSGLVEAYSLTDQNVTVVRYNTSGRVETRPTITSATVSWPTDDGKLYTANANSIGIRTSRKIGDSILAPVGAAAPGLLFVAATDGFVECLDELRLSPVWRFSTGEAVLHPPVAVGGNLYLITELGGMYCVDPKTGNERWWSPGIRQFLAASQTRAYAADEFGRIAILDLATGGRLGTLGAEAADVKLINPFTDRILIGSRTGLIQCLHEPSLDRPLVHFPMPQKRAAPAAKPAKQPSAGAPAAGESGPVDPFGGPAAEGGAVDPFAPGVPGEPAAEPSEDEGPSEDAGEDAADPFADPAMEGEEPATDPAADDDPFN